MGDTGSISEEIRTFFERLTLRCELDDTIEIRVVETPLHGEKKVRHREFIPHGQIIEKLPHILHDWNQYNIYFSPALRKNGNGTKEGVSQIPWLWADIDFKHAPQDQAEKIISELPIQPSVEVFTGGGYHLYWFLKEPLYPQEIPLAETLLKRLSLSMNGDNGVCDIAHMMRFPGSVNRKPDRGNAFVRIVELNEREVDPSDFDSILPHISTLQTKEFESEKYSERLEKIMQCEFLRHCDKDRSSLSEPEWLAMISILSKEVGGREASHSLSKGYPGYNPKECDEKILHSMSAGPATCAWIRNLWDCDRDCGVKSPVALPYKEPAQKNIEDLSYLNLHLPSSLEISQMEIKVDWIVKNLIPKESITLLHSIGGVGKTYLMYGIAKAVVDGEPFFGLDVMRMNVYYIDFENPLPEIVDRMKKIGGSENMWIWHLGHDPAPIRFDADGWKIYKTFPPGLFIIDSLRSSHLLEENSSKDAAFIMARHKEIRALGNTIIQIHHENKIGGYRGSTAWFDLADHILKFSRVKAIGSDEDAAEEDFDLPIRLGLGGKSRFSSAMELKPMYFKFQDHRLYRADDPEQEILEKMAGLLNPLTAPPNQSEFQKLAKENLGIGKKDFRKLLKKGENLKIWFYKQSGSRNKLEYFRGVKC